MTAEELKLECLKLASLNKKEFMLEESIVNLAAVYYGFVKKGGADIINAVTAFKRK